MEGRKGEEQYIKKINLPSLNAEFGAALMSEILQSVRSVAVTNEVIKQREVERGLRNAFLHFRAPRSISAVPSCSSRSCWKHTVWPLLPHDTRRGGCHK